MLDILKNRRSIRKYRDKKVEDEKVQQLVQAALLSPTSRNFYSWEFIVVEDRETIDKLAQSKTSGSAFMKEAPLAFVVLGDPQVCDVWVEDASIASIIIQLTAEDLGLGSCWIQIRKRNHSEDVSSEEYVKKLLNIPEDKTVLSIIAIGYPAEDRPALKIEDLKFDKIHRNGYGL